jgi:hypothetical protein
MYKYTQKLFGHIIFFLFLMTIAIVNWLWPLTLWLGDTPLYRFIWLGIFFILLDIAFEIGHLSFKQIELMGDVMKFGRDLRKLSKGFQVLSNIVLPNNTKADYIVAGPSGIWLITVKDKEGKITFNGDELAQDEIVLKGLLTESLAKSYALGELLKKKLNRDIKVASVVSFSSFKADLGDTPNIIRGVYVSSRQKLVSLIEDTDYQILDGGAIDEIVKILKNTK